MSDDTRASTGSWHDAWPDALAFASGLTLAWLFEWQTRDLVWSLWLSSLLVGYAMIIWSIFRPGAVMAARIAREKPHRDGLVPVALLGAGAGAYLAGGLLLLAFFTVHFGMFHFVHSVFLNSFFPIVPEGGFGNWGLYAEVVTRYWWFVPVAALAERKAFRWHEEPATPPDVAVTVAAIAARKKRNAQQSGFAADGGMMGPYKNVVRLHLLIFFFAFAHFAGVENFAVYAIVYAVYFFPWRLLARRRWLAAN